MEYYAVGQHVWVRHPNGIEHKLCDATTAESAQRIAAALNASELRDDVPDRSE